PFGFWGEAAGPIVGAAVARTFPRPLMTPRPSEWIVTANEAGTRLDKFLAAPDRLGSRSRAPTALERGKVYVNGEEASIKDASRPLAGGDDVRVWIDRPGSAKP